MILARYREELDLDLPQTSMVTDPPTVGHLRRFLSTTYVGASTPASAARVSISSSAVSSAEPKFDAGGITKASSCVTTQPSRPAQSMNGILRGRPCTDPHTTFLFPDGSGSAASYTSMTLVRPGLAIIALNCPYFRHREQMETVTFDNLMGS